MTAVALWLAGWGHFSLLVVSAQVPARLGWRTELARLSAFNRQFVWVTGGFIVFTYLGFGVLTLTLHDEMVRGERSAVALATFIGLYWLVRVVVDRTAFRQMPWPAGWFHRLAHGALFALFNFFAVVYLVVAVRSLR